jgi:FtsP/CotA-like multicopper oxidase with cupredoxin domain
MNRTLIRNGFLFIVAMTVLVGLFLHPAQAVIHGETGALGAPSFSLTAMEGSIRTGDGDSVPMWLFAASGKTEQYPGPTLIVTQGDSVRIKLKNQLRLPDSIVIPGMSVKIDPTDSKGGVPGLLTTEVPPDNGNSYVTYTFTATQPGTYTYYSGTQPELEVEMGLQGAIVVRPSGFTLGNNPAGSRRAFTNISTAYDREYLMLLSEIDVEQHKAAGRGELRAIDHTDRRPVTWFENGRTMPDTVADAAVDIFGTPGGTTYLPSQPYNSFPQSHPGEKILIRFVGAGLDLHPLHTHGQNHLQIAREGAIYVGVGQRGEIAGQVKPPIQNGVVKSNSGFGPIMLVRSAVASRVRQLQANQQSIVGTSGQPVFFDQGGSQPREPLFGMGRQQQLIGIGPPLGRDRHRLATPN